MHTPRRHPRTAVRLGAVAVLTATMAVGAAGCGHEDDDATDTTLAQSPSAATTSTSASARDFPSFTPENYTYRLEVLCYCPQVGAVRVTVEDGKVAEAKTVSGDTKGTNAPAFARLTINDIIERANDPELDKAEVTWPAGQDYPSVVALDQLAMAVDDEITYTITNVRVQ